MFSGIVETKVKSLEQKWRQEVLEISVERPPDFNDIRLGDSIATNGVCLTVESMDEKQLTFALGPETLKITKWTAQFFQEKHLNLERSLKWGDRVHGHYVSGHAESLAEILDSRSLGESWFLQVRIPDAFTKYIWKKGSATINGVSLTINEVKGNVLEFGLIPETLRLTNLAEYKIGEFFTFEPDSFAKGITQYMESNIDHIRNLVNKT